MSLALTRAISYTCQARALIDEQINPNEHKKIAKAQAYAAANVEAEHVKITKVQTLTVQDLAKAWLMDGVARKDGNAELQRRFNSGSIPARHDRQKSADSFEKVGHCLRI